MRFCFLRQPRDWVYEITNPLLFFFKASPAQLGLQALLNPCGIAAGARSAAPACPYLVFIVAGRRNRDSGLGDGHTSAEMLPPARHSSCISHKGTRLLIEEAKGIIWKK